MKIKKTIIILLLLSPTIVCAVDEKTAKANVANELVVCAAYFFIGSQAAEKNGDKPLAANIKSTADAALATSINLSNKEIAVATLKLAMQDHQQLINNNVGNIGILIKKYKSFCKSLISSPKNRYNYWLNKK